MPLRIAVTGASGYVGGAIAQALAAAGHHAVAIGRRPVAGFETLQGSLEAPPDAAVLRGAGLDALVHCAYDFKPRLPAELARINIDGSARLFDAAAQAGIARLVLISSISAFDGCRSRYGQAKLAIERHASALGAHALRPGLVVGAAPGGMVGTLAALARRLPIVPLIGDGTSPLYMVREGDLARLVCGLAAGEIAAPAAALAVAWPEAADLRAILSVLAAAAGRKPLLLPVPAELVRLAIRTAETLLPGFPLRSDSVVSLLNPDPAPPFDRALMARLGFEPVWFPAHGPSRA